jgi:hypothetical protein
VADQEISSELRRRIEREASDLKPTRLTLDTVSWGDGPDAGKLWIPDDLTPLRNMPAYEDLTEEQRLRYNQYYALEMTEQFIWLERYCIIPPLQRLLREAIPTPSLRTLLESFVADERHHNASLYRLLQLARPDLYEKSPFYFFVPPWKVRLVTGVMVRLPRLLSSWVLLIGTLEEQTVMISQVYRNSNTDVDPLFAEVYALHAQDEGRHCKLDSMNAEWLIAPQSGWAERVNGKFLDLAFQAYHDVGWGCDRPIRQLVADFADLRDREAAMIDQTMAARTGASAGRCFSDQALSPITARNVERYAMLDRAIRHLTA